MDNTHPFLQTILRYYDGCNTADVELMASTFTDDVVHYFVDHAPVRGREGLAHYWAKVGPATKAHWSVDNFIAQKGENAGENAGEAVIEWSMRWQPKGAKTSELLRGTEWFIFRGGLIAEVRSYHNNVLLQSPKNAELHDFDYARRGYTQR